MTGKIRAQGFVRQEQIEFDDFITNRFGQFYEQTVTSRFEFNGGSDHA